MGASGILTGAGELSERIRAHDWSGTPLGPIDAWPQSLLTTLDIMLTSPFPNRLEHGLTSIEAVVDDMAGQHIHGSVACRPQLWLQRPL